MKLLFASFVAMSAALLLTTTGCTLNPTLHSLGIDPTLHSLAIPVELRAPAGQSVFLKSHASGVQIYQCKAAASQLSIFEWAFVAPEAALTNASGQVIGKHYAGPTWEFLDGSTVAAAAKARHPGPDVKAIPWLLLGSTSNAGDGVFSRVTSIQRLYTSGGIAPTEPCDASNTGQIARVPYTAMYYFYRATPTGQ